MHDDGGGFSTPNVEKMMLCWKVMKKRGKEILETVEVCEEDDSNGKKGKREQKIPVYGKSHFVERIVKIGGKVKKAEMALYNSVFALKRDYGNTFIHVIIIDYWTSLLNIVEELKDVGSVSRVFFDTNFLAQEILDASLSADRTKRLFDSMLKVFFPIVEKSKYYLICFDLRVPTYYIIDHVNRTGVVEDIYGKKPVHVKKLLGNYLKTEHYQKSTAFNKIKARVMKITWKVEKEGSDCGVYLMRNMESYMGENERRWDYGFIGKKQSDVLALNNLRIKYTAKLMNEVKESREKQRRGRRQY
ncbi:unnamed protein product [Lactuca saligna]|uniref:Ubiquitin-like protease family profile domain-containing protein n=1 Tax=Lactuca saligna TaxID=75948 RepID=A0AA35ZKX0_LACSI|nr:unnamed protein product [Lactuca saligna]